MVCITAPMPGMAKYASWCSWLFQAKVATRSPGPDAQAAQAGRQLFRAVGQGAELDAARARRPRW